MFDANYFVEVALLNGHVHRVRAVIEVADGYVILAAHQPKGDLSHERPRFGAGEHAAESVRVAASYDSIAAVVIDPAPDKVKARPGFAS
jgi:hypothetical protein